MGLKAREHRNGFDENEMAQPQDRTSERGENNLEILL